MLKWPVIVESWLYRDPGENPDALLARSARIERAPCQAAPGSTHRDRYYRQARRFSVRQAMRGKR
jgi:hypothetical protein